MNTFAAPTLGKPSNAYEDWRKDWKPPLPLPVAILGKVIVEFSPFANEGQLWLPEQESNNAMVVHDGHSGGNYRCGFIPTGQEICYTGTTGTYFEYGGRRLCVLRKADIELLVTDNE